MPLLVLRYDLQPRANGEPKHWNERILEPDVVHVVVACAMDEFTDLTVAAEESLENRRLDARAGGNLLGCTCPSGYG